MWDVEMAKYVFFLEWNNNYFRKMIDLAGKCYFFKNVMLSLFQTS